MTAAARRCWPKGTSSWIPPPNGPGGTGTEIELSPKEFSLLEFFLRHPGTVLTRSQIIEAVWDFAYDGTSNVVDQYVKYLRRKVDIPFGRHDIQTVRGMGYRLRHDEPA